MYYPENSAYIRNSPRGGVDAYSRHAWVGWFPTYYEAAEWLFENGYAVVTG